MQTNCSITLYNKYIDKTTTKECYKKTIIEKANWQGGSQSSMATTTTGKGVLNVVDSINIFIPFINNFSSKTYIEPKAWNKLLDIDRDNFFTFQQTDFIVKGVCSFEFVPVTNLIGNLTKDYDNVITIMSAIVNDNGSKYMKHYSVGGK